jgi:hypothetical protein
MTFFHKGRMARGGIAALMLLAAGATPAAGAVNAAATGTPGHLRDGHPHTVTLITGDRVTVGGADATTGSVQAGPGRSRMSFALSSADVADHADPGRRRPGDLPARQRLRVPAPARGGRIRPYVRPDRPPGVPLRVSLPWPGPTSPGQGPRSSRGQYRVYLAQS